MVITEQVGSTEVQFIIPRKDKVMLRHLPQAQEEEIQFLCSTQISCKSNSTWAILQTEILDMLFSIASHLMSTAPQLYLMTCAALRQWDPFIPHDRLVMHVLHSSLGASEGLNTLGRSRLLDTQTDVMVLVSSENIWDDM